MMLYEDYQAIYEKFKYVSFWKSLTYDDIVDNSRIDFFRIEEIEQGNKRIWVDNCFWTGKIIVHRGSIGSRLNLNLKKTDTSLNLATGVFEDGYIEFEFFVDEEYEATEQVSPEFRIIDNNTITRTPNHAVVDKIYIENIGGLDSLKMTTMSYDSHGQWDMGDVLTKTIQTDEKGSYIDTLGVFSTVLRPILYIGNGAGSTYYLMKIKILPDLPIIELNPVYKGNKDKLSVSINNEEIDESYYSIIYQGKTLKNNIINVPADATEAKVKVYINHPNYVKTSYDIDLTLVDPIVRTQSELDSLVENGLNYFIPSDLELSDYDYKNLSFKGGVLILQDGTFTNCNFNGTELDYINRGTLINSQLNNTVLMQAVLKLENTVIEDSEIFNSRIEMVGGRLSNNNLTQCLIISDTENLEISNNQFMRANKNYPYFPNTLYLTGALNVYGNIFYQNEVFETLNFNLALIKMLDNTDDLDKFVMNNTFDLRIEYNEEVITDLLYCIVDEDNLKRRRLQ